MGRIDTCTVVLGSGIRSNDVRYWFRRVNPFAIRFAGSKEERVSDNLVIVARNEYGEFDRRALALYGLEMVIEPYRETTISIRRPKSTAAAVSPRFRWLLVIADEFGLPLENAEAEINAPGGSFATVTLNEAGATYALLVQQVLRDGSVIAEGRVKISCKYVRREVRDLTADDRTRFFSAMRDFYTVTLEAGREKYGDGYVDAKRVAAFHNSEVSSSEAFCSFLACAPYLGDSDFQVQCREVLQLNNIDTK